MNPTVVAAAIGVGGTVIVGMAGFGAAIWNTKRTIAADRDSRLWDKQTVAYEQALAELANRKVRLERVLRTLWTASKPTKVLKEYNAARDRPAWFSAEGMLLAYSSDEVRDALGEARSAGLAASEILDELQKAWQDVGAKESLERMGNPETTNLVNKMFAKLHEVDDSDKALINAIRAELHGAPAESAEAQGAPAESNDSRPS